MKSQRMPASSDGPERLLREKVQCNSLTGRVRVSAVLALLFAVIVLASYPGSAAVSPSQPKKSQALPKPVAEPMPAPEAAPEPNPAPPPPPTPEQLPPKPPEVAWDGKQLSINADNSTLYDILMVVRARLGTSIDVPASASSERVAVHLGPAPARAVLSALLEGSNYDYIIKARESNQNEIQSMIVTLRGEGSDKDVHGDKDTNSATVVLPGAVRRPPGYSRSGKPAFQEQMSPEQESSSTPDPPTVPIPNTTEPAAVSADSKQPAAVSGDSNQPAAVSGDSNQPAAVSGDSNQPAAVSGDSKQPAAASADSKQPAAASADSKQPAAVSGDSKQPAAQPVAETPATTPVASPAEASQGSDSNPLIIESTPVTAGAVVGPTPTTPAEMSDQLQRMYELRRQMQAKQNQATTPPPNP